MQGVDPRQKAELIDHIYDVALDPARYEELLDIWEKRVGPLRHLLDSGVAEDGLSSDPDLVLHARRASEFLGRMRDPVETQWQIKLATEVAAAFCVAASGQILGTNRPAEELLDIHVGRDIRRLRLSLDEREELSDAVRTACRSGRPSLLRFAGLSGERTVVFHVAPCNRLKANRLRSCAVRKSVGRQT